MSDAPLNRVVPAVGTVCFKGDDVLLIQRGTKPLQGQWSLPGGRIERGEHADAAAVRELKEETGLTANEMIYVGFQYLAYGFCNQGYHIYVAKGLTQGEQKLDVEEEDLRIVPMSLTTLRQMILDGVIKDAATCNAFGLATLKGII